MIGPCDRVRLLRFAEKDLPPLEATAVAEHAERCPECGPWLDTYRALAAAARPVTDDPHASPDLIARYSVEPAEVTLEEEQALLEHLHGCTTCRQEVRLAGDALHHAKEPLPDPLAERIGRGLRLRWRAALAAGVVFGLLGFALLRDRPVPAATAPTKISDRSFQGTELVEAEGALYASAIRVESGSAVTFRAGGIVAIGDGFAVGESARFTIENATPTAPREF